MSSGCCASRRTIFARTRNALFSSTKVRSHLQAFSCSAMTLREMPNDVHDAAFGACTCYILLQRRNCASRAPRGRFFYQMLLAHFLQANCCTTTPLQHPSHPCRRRVNSPHSRPLFSPLHNLQCKQPMTARTANSRQNRALPSLTPRPVLPQPPSHAVLILRCFVMLL